MTKRRGRRRTRNFSEFPLIHIDPQVSFGNPTVGMTKLTVAKVWEMVNNSDMESLVSDHPNLTLEAISTVLEFADWCMDVGLMDVRNGRLFYDKDALYAAAKLDIHPRGKLCLYCGGFLVRSSPAWTEIRERQGGSEDFTEGVCHGGCLQAVLCGEVPPRANVFPWELSKA